VVVKSTFKEDFIAIYNSTSFYDVILKHDTKCIYVNKIFLFASSVFKDFFTQKSITFPLMKQNTSPITEGNLLIIEVDSSIPFIDLDDLLKSFYGDDKFSTSDISSNILTMSGLENNSLQLNIGKFYDCKEFSDIIFIVGDTKEIIYAHKCILAARNKKFAALFLGGMIESKTNEIKLPHIKPLIFRKLLQYLYSDTTTIQDDVLDIIIISNEYNCIGLIQFCEQELSHSIDSTVAFNLLQEEFCDIHNAPLLKQLCLHQLAKDKVCKQPNIKLKDYYEIEKLRLNFYNLYYIKLETFEKELVIWNKEKK